MIAGFAIAGVASRIAKGRPNSHSTLTDWRETVLDRSREWIASFHDKIRNKFPFESDRKVACEKNEEEMILRMLDEGQITVTESEELLSAMSK